ncbi:MAG: glycoside hydrolase family 3 protein [Micromonosporaceae bacterium]|nr:glycoside hydrolase family 3 protein [Micromonosporaceae bacterium]
MAGKGAGAGRGSGIADLVDRCLLIGFEEPAPPDWLLRAAPRVGGIALYGCNLPADGDVAHLATTLRSQTDVLIAVDEEGGDVTRLHYREGSPDPGNLVLGTADELGLTSAVAGGIAARLRAAGVGFNLAPVVDVNADPDNPVIGVRSFGADPAVVSRQAAAWIAAAQAGGVATCAKHFPGHGDTRADSHLTLPVVGCDEAQLRAVHLPPFAAAIEAGVAAVMTAHLTVPALDSRPATLSPRILGGLLRGELGFDGVIVTDALDMGAMTRGYGSEAAAVAALAAGADLLCLGVTDAQGRYQRVRAAVSDAVACGDLPLARVAEAADRVDRLRSLVASWASRPVGAGGQVGDGGPVAAAQAAGAGGAPDLSSAGMAAAERAAQHRGLVPLCGPPVVVELGGVPNLAVGEAGWSLAAPLAASGCPPALVVRMTPDRDPQRDPELAAAVAAASGGPLVLVGRDVARHPWQLAVLERVRTARPDAVLVELGLPRLGGLPDGPLLCVGGAARPNLAVAAHLLVGGGR